MYIIPLLILMTFTVNPVDSLYGELERQPANAGLLNEIAAILVFSSPAEADSMAMIALDIAQRDHNLEEKARAAANISNAAFEMMQFRRVLEYSEMAAGFYRELENPIEAGRYMNDAALASIHLGMLDNAMAKYRETVDMLIELRADRYLTSVLANMGRIYRRWGMYDSAKYVIQWSIDLMQEHGIEAEISAAYTTLGIVFRNTGDYDQALHYYNKALEVAEAFNDSMTVATNYSNIAVLYAQLDNTHMAKEYFYLALQYFESLNRFDRIEAVKGNLSALYSIEEDLDKAHAYLEDAMALANQFENRERIIRYMNEMGKLKRKMGRYDEAIESFREVIDIGLELGRQPDVCYAFKYIGQAYYETGNVDSALQYYHEAYDCSSNIGMKSLSTSLLLALTRCYEESGNYSQALFHHKEYSNLKEEVETQEMMEKLAEIEAVYQNEKKQQEIQLLQKDNELSAATIRKKRIQMYWLGSGLLIFVGASIIIASLFFQKSRAHRMLVKKNILLMKQSESCDPLNTNIKNSPGLSEDEKKRLVSKINQLIWKEKIFTQKSLTMSEMAEKLNTNTSYLSHIINTDFGRSFNDFINQLRIQEAQKMFTRGDHKQMTIEGIAEAVGFQSRSTFHNAFRKFSGLAPSVFIKNMQRIYRDSHGEAFEGLAGEGVFSQR
ncbi:MAG: DUF2225 domain-containing protein [Bacteroidia bacterium]|nr:MAG: DUF2225 domain-containing protein [Bacteroidia bacterium]